MELLPLAPIRYMYVEFCGTVALNATPLLLISPVSGSVTLLVPLRLIPVEILLTFDVGGVYWLPLGRSGNA